MNDAGVNKFKSMEQIRAEASKIVSERNSKKKELEQIKEPKIPSIS
jgi:hypothetical protein